MCAQQLLVLIRSIWNDKRQYDRRRKTALPLAQYVRVHANQKRKKQQDGTSNTDYLIEVCTPISIPYTFLMGKYLSLTLLSDGAPVQHGGLVVQTQAQ